jgi:predicted MFS family arabinose efflux permease
VYWGSEETRAVKHEPHHFFASFRASLQDGKMRRYFLANFLLYLALFSLWRFLPVFLERRFDFTASELAYTIAYESVAGAFALFVLMKGAAQRFSPRKAVIIFSTALGIMLGVVVLPASPTSLVWTIPVIGSCIAMVMTNASVLVSNTARPDLQGQTMGNLQAVQVLAEVVVGVGGGMLAASNPALPLYIGGAMAVCCALALVLKARQ